MDLRWTTSHRQNGVEKKSECNAGMLLGILDAVPSAVELSS